VKTSDNQTEKEVLKDLEIILAQIENYHEMAFKAETIYLKYSQKAQDLIDSLRLEEQE
jgi:hypothetical protein